MTLAERREIQLQRLARSRSGDYPHWFTRQDAPQTRGVRLADLQTACRCGGAGPSDYLCAACGRVNEQFS